MLPYLHLLYFRFGPIKVYTWGLFVSLGFLIALAVLIKKYPKDKNVFIDLLFYILIGSMFGARLFYVLFYAPDMFGGLKDFFKIWQGGMSSFGGFFGGALVAYVYARVKKIKFYGLAEKVAFAAPLGLAIARIGCYLINDHPGVKTSWNFMAVAYPDGARFDLGLLEFFLCAAIFIYFVLKRPPSSRKAGKGAEKPLYLENFLVIYGLGRFLLDFLRVGERACAGLIPSQYGSIILLAIGLYLIIKNKKYGILEQIIFKN